MLVGDWILETLGAGYANYEQLCTLVGGRAADQGLAVGNGEIRVLLERMIRDGRVEPCQFLAEEQRYAPTVYDGSHIFWYWFRPRSAGAGVEGEHHE